MTADRVTYAYASEVTLWNLARLTPLARFGPFEFADLIGWVWLVPLPFFLVIALWRRRWFWMIEFVNTHLPRPILGIRRFDARRQTPVVDALVAKMRDTSLPAVLVGDFNIGDRHYLYRRLRHGLGDAYREAGWGLGLTWSLESRIPYARIDYVLHDDAWFTRAVRRGRMPGSDHRSLTADLVLH
jgi:endonuclease/exonuclease/phosphatase family metal-dependent hydrolase